jgi:membrane protein
MNAPASQFGGVNWHTAKPAAPRRPFHFKDFFGLLKKTFDEWNEDKAPRLGAALSFYTVFSLAPLLIIVIAIAGLAFGQQAAQSKIDEQIRGLVGAQGADLVQAMIENARKPQEGILATVIGFATLLLGGLGAFGQLQEALNTIWEVTPKPGRGLRGIIQDRLISSGLVLGIGFLLLVSLVISAGLSALGNFVTDTLGELTLVAQALNMLISFLVITFLFALIFKFLPDVKIAWRDVWTGAALTSILFNLGKAAIGFYLGSSSVASAYGAAGSLIILLLWVYYSAQILLFGAEFTQVYANQYGSQIQPAENALPLTEGARAQQGLRPRAPTLPPPELNLPRREQIAALMVSPTGQLEEFNPLRWRRQRDHQKAIVSFVAGLGLGALLAFPARSWFGHVYSKH